MRLDKLGDVISGVGQQQAGSSLCASLSHVAKMPTPHGISKLGARIGFVEGVAPLCH